MSSLPRRSFLGLASGAAVAACAPLRALAAAAPTATPWHALRNEFALARDRVHLAGLFLASNPRPVREAIERYRRMLDEDPVTPLEHDLHTGERTNATLDAAARYLGGARDDIALTDSTTSGLAVVYGGLTLRPGDEVITTRHDHWVSHETLRLAAERSGAKIRTVPLYEAPAQASAAAMVKAIESALSPATRAVAVTWVHSSTGVKIPVRAMADVIAKANAARPPAARILLCVDGVHGLGIEDATMPDLGCDLFIAGCHKWMFGPRGTGLVWGRKPAWERLRPTGAPFDIEYIFAREYGGSVPKPTARQMMPGGFRAFEHRWALREAFLFHLAIGKERVQGRIHELASQCKAGLGAMRHVTLHTPRDPALSSGLVCFEVAGLTPDAVVARLREQRIIASDTPYRPSYARFSPGLTNTPEEIERALAAVRKLA